MASRQNIAQHGNLTLNIVDNGVNCYFHMSIIFSQKLKSCFLRAFFSISNSLEFSYTDPKNNSSCICISQQDAFYRPEGYQCTTSVQREPKISARRLLLPRMSHHSVLPREREIVFESIEEYFMHGTFQSCPAPFQQLFQYPW